MGSAPAPFSDIGKKARDLLTKDYNFNHKFSLATISSAGLGITATGVKVDEVFVGDISTNYKNGKTTVDVKVDTNSNVSTTVTVNEIISGAKTAFSFKIPDQKSGKLDVQYLGDHVAIDSSIGMNTNPVLELAAAIGSKEFVVGTEVGFDSTSATFTKYNAGISFNQRDFSAALMLADKGETVRASYIHFLDPLNRSAVAAEMFHRLKTSENSFTIGTCHAVDPLTLLKAKLSNNGKVSVLCQHEWRPKSLVTISAEYDPKSVISPSRLGLVLALKP
ncbi:mitochondrial outer membrane protein porin 6 [Phalaenopsis equestris]|uniref:mitochondrial outer membrane protein porin 6 n=1 Tax=Phalaenopsis equestris TaxID=78828 RepID=UPI0009E22664|nr:mitochondrial outer membrane protein porin 6 [Phalaenopsis equestris]